MAGSLTETQVAAYRRDGFLFPLDVFTAPDAAAQSYLRVIARMPDAIAKALHDAA